MKLAVTSTGPELSSPFVVRFGRATLLFVDTPLRTFTSLTTRWP